MRQLLAALGHDIKPSGKDWTARCPVHMDSDFAMSIKQASDGSILAHCFACGANGLDLYKTLGLDLDELFGGKKLDNKDYIPQNIKDEHEVDKLVIMIYRGAIKKGKSPSLVDKRRFKLAEARIKGVESKYGYQD